MIFLHDLLLVFSLLKLFNIISLQSPALSTVAWCCVKLNWQSLGMKLSLLYQYFSEYYLGRPTLSYLIGEISIIKTFRREGKKVVIIRFLSKRLAQFFFNFRKRQFILFLILDSCYRFPSDGLDLIVVSWLWPSKLFISMTQ